MKYYLVEKNNHLAIHGIFNNLESARRHLKNVIPEYCKKGFFDNKTLNAESFIIKGKI